MDAVITAVLLREGAPLPPADYPAAPGGGPPPVLLVPDSQFLTCVTSAPGGPPRPVVITGRYELAAVLPPAAAGHGVYRYAYTGSVPL